MNCGGSGVSLPVGEGSGVAQVLDAFKDPKVVLAFSDFAQINEDGSLEEQALRSPELVIRSGGGRAGEDKGSEAGEGERAEVQTGASLWA